jgi:hypothetical protein
MKKLLCLVISLGLWSATSAFAQDKPSPPPTAPVPAARLTRFDLDFPGGTPGELVAAIEQSTGRPLNAIVRDEDTNLRIPALKMKDVTVVELFDALKLASKTTQGAPAGGYYDTSYGFIAQSGGRSDGTVWVFYNDLPQNAKISRFFLLTPYLEQGMTVDDITTAIQTGWKMLGVSPPPALKFHKETNLLIAVGNPLQIQTIEQVLEALRPRAAAPVSKPVPAKAER